MVYIIVAFIEDKINSCTYNIGDIRIFGIASADDLDTFKAKLKIASGDERDFIVLYDSVNGWVEDLPILLYYTDRINGSSIASEDYHILADLVKGGIYINTDLSDKEMEDLFSGVTSGTAVTGGSTHILH